MISCLIFSKPLSLDFSSSVSFIGPGFLVLYCEVLSILRSLCFEEYAWYLFAKNKKKTISKMLAASIEPKIVKNISIK
jgi:hypothetical protein